MQSTSMPHLDDNTSPIAVSSSGQWAKSTIGGLSRMGSVSDHERKSDLAASEMHLWWREGSGYSGYLNVAVLMVRWAEHLDQLNCGGEVSYMISSS